jgi:SAM-dependent methyltransferase
MEQSVPPNCRFEVDDAEDEWTFSTQFDYIHGRALMTCFKDPPQVIQSAYKSLTPGGWLELQDFYYPLEYMDDPVPTDSALYKWNQLCMEGGLKSGRAWTHAPHYKRYLEEAGFQEVVERRFYWPLGAWAKGQYYQTLGAFMQELALNGLEGISLKVMGSLGWTIDEIGVFLAQVRKDMKDPSIHAYMNMSV